MKEERRFTLTFNEHEWWVIRAALRRGSYIAYALRHGVDVQGIALQIQDSLDAEVGR